MSNKRVIVYVKHYLNATGINYFKEEWFPRVHAIISKQPGYLAITYEINGPCATITLLFKDCSTFDAWCAMPTHDHLVDHLDTYRDRDYWEAVRAEDEEAEPSQLDWTKITPRGIRNP